MYVGFSYYCWQTYKQPTEYKFGRAVSKRIVVSRAFKSGYCLVPQWVSPSLNSNFLTFFFGLIAFSYYSGDPLFYFKTTCSPVGGVGWSHYLPHLLWALILDCKALRNFLGWGAGAKRNVCRSGYSQGLYSRIIFYHWPHIFSTDSSRFVWWL